MSRKMVKFPSSSSSSETNILPAKPVTRSKKRLLPKNTGWFEKTYSEPLKVSKSKVNNVWQLFSEVSPRKRKRRQRPAPKKTIPATITDPTEIMEEELDDLIIEDDIEVMRDVSATTISSPKRSEKFSKFLQKFNKSSRIRKEFKSPRPVKRKRLPSDHKPIPELDDLEYDVFEDTDSSECLKSAESGGNDVSIQYDNLPKYLQNSPSIPVGLSRKFHNSTAVDGHHNNLLEFSQDISVITSGSSKQTSEETTPRRLPALHSGNKKRKKSCNKEEEQKKPASSTRLFQTNCSDLSIPDLSPIIQVTGSQAEDKYKSLNKRKSSSEEHNEDAGKVIEKPPSPLSLIKIIVDKTLVNKQSTFRQGDGIHLKAEFGISSIKDDDDDDDDDFLQPKPDTRYIDSKDFYQTYDLEEIEVPDVICIEDEEDKDVVTRQTSMKDGNKLKDTPSNKENEDQSTRQYYTNNSSIHGEGSAIVEKLLNKKSSKLSTTAQTILNVSSGSMRISGEGSTITAKPGGISKLSKTAKTILKVASPGSMHISGEGSTLVAKPSSGSTSKLSKTAQAILAVTSSSIGDNNNTVVRDDSDTLVEKRLKRNSSKMSKTAETILDLASPGAGERTKNKSIPAKYNPSTVNSSKYHHKPKETIKPSAYTKRKENIFTMKDNFCKSRRQSSRKADDKEISICCLQTLQFPPPIKMLISQKTIPFGKRLTTELQTAAEDILCKAVPPPKGVSKESKKNRSMYYFKDVKRYGRGK